MLIRWEEYVNPVRDKHNRFPAIESIAYKFNFLNRLVVNEYIEMLWNMIRFVGFNRIINKRSFQLLLTHDVDSIFKYSSLKSGFREIAGDIIKRRDLILAFKNIKTKFMTHSGIFKDPYDTFDYLMDISEKYNTKSYSFLHSSKSAQQDIDNSKHLRMLAEKIKNRGHFTGYHPSYNAYNNSEIFKKDKEIIENITGVCLKFGRQHFLRFEPPLTWQIWEDNNMEWDSTLS